jgi:hypothetical protein
MSKLLVSTHPRKSKVYSALNAKSSRHKKLETLGKRAELRYNAMQDQQERGVT